MLSFLEYTNLLESIDVALHEASMGRVKQHIDRKDPVVFISASRDENGVTRNNERFKELQKAVLDAGFGFNKIKGGYIEYIDDEDKPGKKKPKEVDEKSIIIYATPEREEELKKFALGIGKKYAQDSIFFRGTDGVASLLSSRRDSSVSDKIGHGFAVGNLHHRKRLDDPSNDPNYFRKKRKYKVSHNAYKPKPTIDDYYSIVGKKKFVFVPDPSKYDPDNVDIEYYIVDKKGRETPVGRNMEGKKKANDYLRRNYKLGKRVIQKYLIKGTNRQVDNSDYQLPKEMIPKEIH